MAGEPMTNDYPFHWLHPDVESRATGTHGDGLYAVRDITAGECVLIFGGYILTVEQEAQLAGKLSDNGVQIAKDLVICSTRTEEWGGENFLNHSCEPNAGFKGQIAVVAMRDIGSGGQITIDYAMVLYHSPGGPAYRLDCACAERRLAEAWSRTTTGGSRRCKRSIAAGFSRFCRRRSTNQQLLALALHPAP